MYKPLPEVPKCNRCARHVFPIKVIREDKETKKKWFILTCPRCDYESDIEPYED